MLFASNETEPRESLAPALGEVVVHRAEMVIDHHGHEYARRDVVIGDESDFNQELKAHYAAIGTHYERLLRINPAIPGTVIQPASEAGPVEIHIPDSNEAAKWLYTDADGEPTQMVEWAKRFPTAIALEPLQRLAEGGAWLEAERLEPRTLEFFTYMVDGIGLRNRARVYSELLLDFADRSGEDSIDILSLGSGAAVPNIQATRRLEEQSVAAHWRFFDFDPQALMFAQKLEEENNFHYATFNYGPEWENPKTGQREPRGQNYVRAFGVENESVDIVDALGLWEYLKPEDAKRFAAALYAKLKPGGSLIVSNMLPSRPQREFNQRAVGWPGLYLRSDTDLLDIVDAAGIDTRQVTMTHSNDGVYVVMEVKKP